jgi:hypothetical protein
MFARRKVVRPTEGPTPSPDVDRLARETNDAEVAKDIPLITAALRTDSIILSADDEARGKFSRLSTKYPSLKNIVWVNPLTPGEDVETWLASNTLKDPSRTLGSFSPAQ